MENMNTDVRMERVKSLAIFLLILQFFQLHFFFFFCLFQEPFNLQLKVFMNEVSQQSLIPVIRR